MIFGKLLIGAGIIIVLVGVAALYAPWALTWFGNLPGDIRIEKENSLILIPISSMIVVSIIGSLIAYFLRK